MTSEIQTKSTTTTKTTTTTTTNNELQRIYFGGIQPPILTVEMVQKRLQSTLSHKIDFVAFDKSKSYTNPWGDDTQTFFFATVRAKSKSKNKIGIGSKSTEEPEESPMEILARQYNNVKWKGCTLRVEKAKLHFLQRLEVERQQAKAKSEAEAEAEAEIVQKAELERERIQEQESSKSAKQKQHKYKTKRHLRIKRQFGEEAYMVDTKPIQTDNQKELHFALKRQREKRRKHLDIYIQSRRKKKNHQGMDSDIDIDMEKLKKKERNLSLQSKVFLNRAIHIHFKDVDEGNSNGIQSSIIYSDDEVNKEAKVSVHKSVDDDDDDEESQSQSSVPSSSSDEEQSKEGYDWSDDEESVNDNDMEEEKVTNAECFIADDKPEPMKGANVSVQKERRDTEEKEANDDASSDAESKSESDDGSEGYAWSDSDDSNSATSDKEEKEAKLFDYNEAKHDDLDEFAASFNDNHTSSWRYGEDDYACEDDASFQDEFLSLEEDVKSNLGIVAKIYPDLSTTAPELFNEDGDKKKVEASAGWDASGLMQRYDPTAVSATHYEVQKEVEEEESNNHVVKSDQVSEGEDSEEDDSKDDASSSSAPSDESDDDEEMEDSVSENGDDEGTPEDSDKHEQSSNTKNDNNLSKSSEEKLSDAQDKTEIYEQKKLENIFQQERTGKGTTNFQMSSLFDQSAITSSEQENKGFSFSFQTDADADADVDADADADAGPETSDTLQLASQDMKEDDIHAERLEDAQKVESSVAVKDPKKNLPKLKKRRGLTFSTQELDVYTTKFFNANEGIDAILAAMKDPKGASTIAEQKADEKKWEEERKILTLDWKRKRKQALNQKKKRLKSYR